MSRSKSRKTSLSAQQLAALHPDKPWLADERWSTGKIKSNDKGTLVASWVFALFWNLVSSPLLFVVPKELDKGNHLALIGLLFPLVGAFLLFWAIANLIHYRKYGTSIFEMSSVPLVDAWFWRSEIKADGNGLQITHGVVTRTRFIAPSEIEELAVVRGTQAGNRLFHRIQLTRGGEKLILGKGIPDMSTAEAVIEKMKRAIGAHS